MNVLDNLYRRRRKPSTAPAVVHEAVAVNPVAFTIHSYQERTRGKLAEDVVERRAKQLHADHSFAPWRSLSETDKELWCHMARVELMSDLTAPVMTRELPPE